MLDQFSELDSIPLKKQGFNIVKQANKRSRKLERENSLLKIQVIDLEEQVEELTQVNLANGASLFQ